MVLRLLLACLALEKKADLDKESRRWAGRGWLLMECVEDVDGRDVCEYSILIRPLAHPFVSFDL